MAALLDLCRFTPTAGGTTDWSYSSALAGCQGPGSAGAVDGTTYKFYAISFDQSQWELAQGVYSASTQTFARTTILYNSSATGSASGQSGAGAKINFSTVPNVAIVGVKEDIISIEESNNFTATQQAQARRNINADFPSGTIMTFQQAVAPTGWTQVTTYNDAALRVVSGAPGSGGSNGFSSVMTQTAVGSYTLQLADIPSHSHSVNDAGHSHGINDPGHAHQYSEYGGSGPGSSPSSGSGSEAQFSGEDTGTSTTGISIQSHTTGITIQNNGGGGAHNHSITMNMKYVDLIIAQKN